jgi:hypothetical protein
MPKFVNEKISFKTRSKLAKIEDLIKCFVCFKIGTLKGHLHWRSMLPNMPKKSPVFSNSLVNVQVGQVVEFVEFIGAMFRSFSWLALPARGYQ